MEALLTEVLALVVLALLTWVANTLRGYIKAKGSKETIDLLEKLADVAVWAVEQKGAGVFSTKKEAARMVILDQLRDMKMLGKFPMRTIDAAIEASVGTNFHYGKHTAEAVGGEAT